MLYSRVREGRPAGVVAVQADVRLGACSRADLGALWGGRRRVVSCRCQLRRRRQGTGHRRGVAVWVHAPGLGRVPAPAAASAAACWSTAGSSFSLRALQAAVKVAFESAQCSLSSRRGGPCSRVGRVCQAARAGSRRLLASSRSPGPADKLVCLCKLSSAGEGDMQ